MMYNKRKNDIKIRIIMNKYADSLKVLRNLNANPLIAAIFEYHCKGDDAYANLLAEIYAAGAEDGLLSYVQELVLKDENPFSVSCAATGSPSSYLKKAFLDDLIIILGAVENIARTDGFAFGKPMPIFRSGIDDSLIYDLSEFYRINGYGKFIGNKAFEYCDGEIVPLTETNDIDLSALKEYERERAAFTDNVLDFLNGLPYAHVLLYGDRGTGKSSTVHAALNAFYKKGLRLIEIDKSRLDGIKTIKREVARLPLKFIIFIDDLSLNDGDDKSSQLRAAIEGSVVSGNNVMIVATSNRRHVIKENFTDRDNSVHPSDCMEEQLSLSDRFGLTIYFSTTDKEKYLSIVRQLAADRGLKTPADELEALAERWAILNGGRSPRRAKQFTDFVYSCEKAKRNINF